MKKTLALLAVAAMMFTAGCGGQKQAEDAAKDAAAKVEETATDVKDAATDAANTAVQAVMATAEDAAAAMKKIQEGDKTGMAIAGVVPGINVERVTEMYGEPVATVGDVLQLENGLDVKVNNKVVEEVSTSFEGLPTPAGIGVGSPATELNTADVYGTATTTTQDNGNTVYKYISNDKRWTISFVTDGDGYITSIVCGLNK